MRKHCFPVSCFLVLVVLIQPALSSHAGTPSDSNTENLEFPPLFFWMLPGGPYFYEGDIAGGLSFSLLEASLLTAGILVNDSLENDYKQEWNVPLLLSSQVYMIEKFSYYRKYVLRIKRHPDHDFALEVDDTPFSELLTAPFTPKVVFSPFVLAIAVLGVIDGIVSYPAGERGYNDISGVKAMGSSMNPHVGTLYYETAAFSASYGAALSEEMVFRGMLLPMLDHSFGKTTGLVSTSLVFGLLHLFNPDIDKPLYFVTQATLAGFVFGYQVQKNDYKLGKAIAAHFWYNMISMTTTWLINPKENPLGIGVTFKF